MHKQSVLHMETFLEFLLSSRQEWYAGWGSLALIIAGLAHSYGRGRLSWFLVGLLLGPLALFLLVIWGKEEGSEKEQEEN